MASFYDSWLKGPAAQQLKANYAQTGPEAAGYQFHGTDDSGSQVWQNGEGNMWNPSQYQPDSPYTTGKQWDSPDLSFEGASDMGLFGIGNANFGTALRNTYTQYGKTDADIVKAAQQALQSHVATQGQGYTAASDWGAINNLIAQNMGVDLKGYDFQTIPGFSAADANARGNADKTKNSSGGFFGQGNIFSDFLSYEESRIGDMTHAYSKDPERVNLGISTPLESSVWGTALGKDYDATVDMYGGATNKQQQAMQQKGLDPTFGWLVQKSIESAVGGKLGEAGLSSANQGAQAGNTFQDGKIDTEKAKSYLPQFTQWLANYGSGGNELSGNQGSQTLTGSNANDTTLSGSKNMSEFDFNDADFSDMNFDMGGGNPGSGLLDFFTNSNGQTGGMPPAQPEPFGNATNVGGSAFTQDPSGPGGGGQSFPGFGSAAGRAMLNFAMNAYMANQAGDKAQTAAQISNPMNQPQRAPFQQQATQMMQNPSDYFENNPFAKAATSATQNLIQSATGKSGNPFQVLGSALPQWMQALGGNYNDLMKIMMTGGGMDQGPGYAGTNYAALSGKELDFMKQGMTGLGGVASSLFGDPSNPKQPQTNPQTGSTQMPQ